MKEKLTELFEYNSFYNVKLIKEIEPHLAQLPARAVDIMNHILNSHTLWNNRLTGKPDIDRWVNHPIENLLKVNEGNHKITAEVLKTRDLSEIIHFRNSKGGTSQSSIEDIYFHLVNHGTYHRGQLAILFRQSGIQPIQTDFIFWKVWEK